MCRSRSVSRRPGHGLAGDAVQPVQLVARQAGELPDPQQLLGRRYRGQPLSREREHRTVLLGEPPPDLCHLSCRPAGADHRPDRRFVRRVEQRRKQAGRQFLELPDHRVAAADVRETRGVVVQGQHPRDLVAGRCDIHGSALCAVHDAVHAGAVLAQLDADLRPVAVQAEGHPHDAVEPVGGTPTESELGGLPQAVRTARDDREGVHPGIMDPTPDTAVRGRSGR